MTNSRNILISWYLLYLTYGILPIVAGIDKFFGLIVDWNMYLNGAIPRLLSISSETLLYTVGIIEIAAGLLVLMRPKIGANIVAIWLICISIELILMGTHTYGACVLTHYDIAIRDIAMAIAAYVLGLLSKELNK